MARGIVDSIQTDMPALTVEQAPEALMHTVMMPVTKLDADQYVAQDIDGVTESLFGSGNLNFMLLQSGQINGLASDNERLFSTDHAALLSGGTYNASSSFVPTASSPIEFTASDTHVSASSMHTAPAFSNSAASFSQSSADPSSFSALPAAAGSFPAAFQSAPALSAQDGVNGIDATANPHDGSNGTNGTNGFNGADGQDGKDGVSVTNGCCCDCGGGTVINIDLGDVTNVITTTVTSVTDILNNLHIGDLLDLSGILHQITDLLGLGEVADNVTEITNNLTDTVTNILHDAASGDSLLETVIHAVDTAADTLNPVINTVTDLTGSLGLDPLLSPVTDILANPGDLVADLVNDPVSTLAGTASSVLEPVTDAVSDLTGALGLDPVLAPVTDILSDPGALLADLANDPVSTLGDTAGAIIDPVVDTVADLGGTLGLDPVVTPVIDIVDNLSLDPILNPAGELLADPLGAIGGILGQADGESDTDAALDTGVPLLQDLGLGDAPNLILDPVENLTGDIDLGADLGLQLLGTNGAGDSGQDSDLTLGHAVDLGNLDLVSGDIDIPLDAVESITGDIDLNILAATDLLSDTANNLTDDIPGGTGDGIILESAGDLAADAAGQLVTDLGGEDGVSGVLEQIAGAAGGGTDILGLLSPGSDSTPDAGGTGDPAALLTGIIDQTLDTAIGLLGDPSSAISDAGSGGGLLGMLSAGTGAAGDITSWPENTISSGDAGGVAADTGGIDQILPDTVGSVAEGLHGLLGGGHHDSGSHGGLLGGLFG